MRNGWKRVENPSRQYIEKELRSFGNRRYYSQGEINHHMPGKLHRLLDFQMRHISKELGIPQKAPKQPGAPTRSRR